MGFSSFKCSLSKTSIPAPYGLDSVLYGHHVISCIMPDNTLLNGRYDGYGSMDMQNTMGSFRVNLYGIYAFYKTCLDNGVSPSVKDYLELNEAKKEHFINKGINGYFDKSLKMPIVKLMHAMKTCPSELKYDLVDNAKPCEYQGYFYDDIYLNVTGKKKRKTKLNRK